MTTDPTPWRDPSLPVDQRVEALLAAMTLDEKLAQLGSYWARPAEDLDDASGDVAPMAHAFAPAADTLDGAVVHGLGHLTRAFGSAPVSVAEGVEKVRTVQRTLAETTRLGIPAIVHEECLTGFTALGATVFPAPIALAATFAPDLVERVGDAMARDMVAVGVQQGLSPVLDVVRDYRWGRVEETFGEDPYLVGTVGTGYVRGLERAGLVATLKHFAGYSASRAGRNHAPVPMGRRELEDVVLPPFEMAVRDGGTRSVMNSYADVDGVPAGASAFLLTEVLRDRWGFSGTVVSDYWTIPFLQIMHKIAADVADAGSLALQAGIDVELPDANGYAKLGPLVADGRLPVEFVDRAVRRVLTQKVELGLLDPDWQAVPATAGVDLDSAHNRTVARELADASVVLLDNDGTLPLTDPPATVALVGPAADAARSFLGCYSFPNHIMARYGDDDGLPIDSLLTAFTRELAGSTVVHAAGVPFRDEDRSGIAAAVEAAQGADLAVVAVGDIAGLFGRGTSGEGCDVVDLTLPGVQADLVEAVLATGTPTVLVVVSGRPYALGAFVGRAAAIVQAFMPGVEGGQAIAGVLSGRTAPSGRLPVGVPDNPGGQPGTYLAPALGRGGNFMSNLDNRPVFPFGYGITYTTFGYSDLALDETEIAADGTVRVSATVTNTGDRDAVEVVQLYLTDDVAQVVRPVRELTGYLRVPLSAGASARVTFDVHADRTSFTGLAGHRLVEAGTFTVSVGRSSEDLPLTAQFTVTGSRRVDGARVMTTPASSGTAPTHSPKAPQPLSL